MNTPSYSRGIKHSVNLYILIIYLKKRIQLFVNKGPINLNIRPYESTK